MKSARNQAFNIAVISVNRYILAVDNKFLAYAANISERSGPGPSPIAIL